MNILSYRGPDTAGGVSGTLAKLLDASSNSYNQWWYFGDAALETRDNLRAPSRQVSLFSDELSSAHYRYCNNFLWPLVHDLPGHVVLNRDDRSGYHQFNMRFARNISRSSQLSKSGQCFINDYQLALSAALLGGFPELEIIFFWHIPWPTSVSAVFAPFLAEFAEGMLGAHRIGFHTQEYADNFLRFVSSHLSGYQVDFVRKRVFHSYEPGRSSEVVALPLGIDGDYWRGLAMQSTSVLKDPKFADFLATPYVLSVDRADYTKGVSPRLDGIDRYFASHKEQLGKLTFVQVCQATRVGLSAFDSYWQVCRAKAAEINARWGNENWCPVRLVDTTMSAKELACLYKHASAMLITPLRDGLNLTAKEFAACSEEGVLLLSPGAGVWHEFRDSALAVNVDDPDGIVRSLDVAMAMSRAERLSRLSEMKARLNANDLQSWWRELSFTGRGGSLVPFHEPKDRHKIRLAR